MVYVKKHQQTQKRGSILPMMALCVTVLFGFVALAIDLGMQAVARGGAQNAADAAALAGARALDNQVPEGMDPDVYTNNAMAGDGVARASLNQNKLVNLTTLSITDVKIGSYVYNTGNQQFYPSFSPKYPESKTPGVPWSAAEVTVAGNQPAFFARIFGISSLPVSAVAVAAHRPRDVALVLDMSGSMKFSSTFQYPEQGAGVVQGLLSSDPRYPRFGHYERYPTSTMPNAFYRTTQFLMGSQEVLTGSNLTQDGPVGSAIIRQFVFDPGNLSNPTTPITTITNPNNLRNAFHRWSPPGMAPLAGNTVGAFGYMSNPGGWANYNAFDTTNSTGPTPAPDSFATQADDVAAKYVGDRFPRRGGATRADGQNWANSNSDGAARSVWDVVFPSSVTAPPTQVTTSPSFGYRAITAARSGASALGVADARVRWLGTNLMATREGGNAWTNYIDSAWELCGYDLDLTTYNSGGSNPTTARLSAPVKALQPLASNPTNGRFHGYSMGPAYTGKTFFVWPPDPRWGNPDGTHNPSGGGIRPDLVLATSNPSSTDESKMVKDSNGNWICDWRRRFFLRNDSANTGTVTGDPDNTAQAGTWKYFNPEADNDTVAANTQNINQVLMNTATSGTGANATLKTTGYKINYRAVLAWIKSGPQVFPPNLRAGRILYYSSIPDHVDGAGTMGTGAANRDQRFWREYIDYVLGFTGNNANYDPRYTLAGTEGSTWAGSGVSVGSTNNPPVINIGGVDRTTPRPYMNYTDIPFRPRLHFWFGPQSMALFISSRIGSNSLRNWNAGTFSEAQTWQLKAGVNSALDDIKKNHPNDQVGSAYFAGGSFKTIRAEMSQEWATLKNALFYPKSLLAGMANGTAPNAEKRPYNDSFGDGLIGDIPNGYGGTDPSTGFALAYNLLSSASAISGSGRRGANKIVIFETDGVPNGYLNNTFTAAGPNSYYTIGNTYTNPGNNAPASITPALAIIDQIVADESTNGFSSASSSARVYPIAFGDLFDSTSTSRGQALTFLQQVAFRGLTSDSAATPLPPYQIITGTAEDRKDKLRDAFERIMQSGVQVTLLR
jgi:hypothetical protein